MLAATVVGSGIMAERLSGGNVAVALLANTGATVAVLAALIALLGPVSGAHFNPAVSVVEFLRGRLTWSEASLYTALQIGGCCLGALLAHAMFELPLWQAATHVRTGPAQWLAEFVATFGLIVTILAVARFRNDAIPVAVGLYITAAYWFTASTSFANPAVTIARAFTKSFAGISPGDVPMFIVAQLLGALMALVMMRWLLDPPSAPSTLRDATATDLKI